MRGSFNARKFGELAFKTVFMDGKGVTVQMPRGKGGGERGGGKYQERFMAWMNQRADPKVKKLTLGKGIPKKYLKEREMRQMQKEQEEQA